MSALFWIVYLVNKYIIMKPDEKFWGQKNHGIKSHILIVFYIECRVACVPISTFWNVVSYGAMWALRAEGP